MVVGAILMSQLTGDQLQPSIDNGTYSGACNVNAVPFLPYAQSKPGDYKIGEYDGLSTLFIPQAWLHPRAGQLSSPANWSSSEDGRV